MCDCPACEICERCGKKARWCKCVDDAVVDRLKHHTIQAAIKTLEAAGYTITPPTNQEK